MNRALFLQIKKLHGQIKMQSFADHVKAIRIRVKESFHFFTFLSLLLSSLLVISCVSSKKFLASEAKVTKLQQDSTATHNLLTNCDAQVKNLKGEKSSLQSDKSTLQDENASVVNDLNTLSAESKMTIADQAKKLKAFQAMVMAQKNLMANLKNSIADALMNYKTDELFVYIDDGNVYVSLQEKLLFNSGSDIVDPKGKEALKSLAKVLNDTKDIMVMIEGHTDSIPINNKLFKDNWDLSTARATSIVRILTVDNGFDSNRITASGKGKFHPIATNNTLEGRASNRRTEIILSPDLKELYKLLYQKD